MNNEPAVIIRLEGNGRGYRPGESLSGEYAFEELPADRVKALEVSVLWYTEGKGDEDMAVHEFWRKDIDRGDVIDTLHPAKIETVLPNSPLSYEGKIVKVRWCVRVRAFLHYGKEVFGQKGFRLGDIAPVQAGAAD
jgi:hypothetical protein